MKKSKGFTLIELLVVIAIIGVLSSIVIASLTSSRNRAADAAIKTNLSHLRSAAEIAYSTLGDTYGSTGATLVNNCSSPPAGSHVFNDSAVRSIVVDAVAKGGTNARCKSANTYYILVVPLKTNSTNAWCVDSKGASIKIDDIATFGVSDIDCATANS